MDKRLEGFPDWIRDQDPNRYYNYLSNVNCPLAQFLRSNYPNADISVSGHDLMLDPDTEERIAIPDYYTWALTHPEERTFGRLVESLGKCVGHEHLPLHELHDLLDDARSEHA